MRIDEGLGGTPADLSVRIFGPDLDELARQAARARELMGQVSGISDLVADQLTGLPQLRIAVDRQATARVHSDVPQLAGLVFATPDASSPPEQPPPYADASEGRISARVDGDTAYLAAANGARYFVGSVLPGGHVVRRITAQAVQLERDGQISWYHF